MAQPTLANLFTEFSPVSGGNAQITNVAVDSTGKILTTTFEQELTPLEQVAAIILAAQTWLYQNTDASVNASASLITQLGPTSRNGVNKTQISIQIQLYTTASTPSVDVTQL
jgi:hypothetical protein